MMDSSPCAIFSLFERCNLMTKTIMKYLPSVAFLMGRYGLSQEVVGAIQGTGMSLITQAQKIES
jgi:hypothetical protein